MQAIPLRELPHASDEAARVMQICNACRYCEGFCAVFPAMTRRLEFAKVDLQYLANLCHNCGACLHACQYAPPHEFGVNVPQAMARVRLDSYIECAWPAAFGAAYRRNGLTIALVLTAALAVFLFGAAVRNGSLTQTQAAGDFYRLFPHELLVTMFLPVFVFAVVALAIGVVRFWRAAPPGPVSFDAAAEAAHNALRLKYLDGGHGDGCNEADDRFTLARRRWHHLVFYGFVLCFLATCVATIWHYGFGWRAPYPLVSVPKLLGTTGGIGLVVGSVGLWRLNLRRDPAHGDSAQRPMDRGFIALLFLTGASGLALMLARATNALPLLLALHLASVMALFLTMPYGKFAHGIYRAAALLKWAVERRRPNTLGLSDD